MRLRHVVVLAAVLSAVTATPSKAQTAAHTEVRAVITRLFEGMRLADTAMVRSTFAPGARFARLDARATPPVVSFDTPDGWITAIGKSGGKWEERIAGLEVRVDGEIAQAWMQYTFYLDGKVRHCGSDAVELMRVPDGWRITYLSDTQKREGCRDLPSGR